jgi:hypothetical protein
MRFQEIVWTEEVDGIWACASLLHVPKTEMDEVWHRPRGTSFLSGATILSEKH